MRLHLLPVLLLSALTLAACGGDSGGNPEPGDHPTGWRLAGLRELTTCFNPGSLAADGAGTWVSCAGDWAGHPGQVMRVDLDGEEETVALEGAVAGPLALIPGAVVVGDLVEGQLFVLDRDGQALRGLEDPVLVCPSDFENGLYQFVSGLAAEGASAYVSCFSSDEVVGMETAGWTETGRAIVDDDGEPGTAGPETLLPLPEGGLVVVASQADQVVRLGTSPSLALTGTPWSTSDTPHGLASSEAGVLVANSDSHTLQAIDPSDGTTRWEVFLGDGANPYDVVVSGDRAFVSLLFGDAVAVVDLTTGQRLGTLALPAGSAPQGLAVLPDGRVAVALTRYDFATYSVPEAGAVAILEPAE